VTDPVPVPAHRRPAPLPLIALAAALGLALVACVTDTRPSTCGEPSVRLDLTLEADALMPSAPAVCRDQEVTLVVDVRVDGILHIHGYDDQVGATEVRSGEPTELSFTAVRSGQFSIELHTDADPQGRSLGILTVHEP
jgi:hypothetical protein